MLSKSSYHAIGHNKQLVPCLINSVAFFDNSIFEYEEKLLNPFQSQCIYLRLGNTID